VTTPSQLEPSAQAFASSTGSLSQNYTCTTMPYGMAQSRVAPGDTSGVANIDHEGTAFQLDSKFSVGGFDAAGSATISPDGC
jgi:hypothetical protein